MIKKILNVVSKIVLIGVLGMMAFAIYDTQRQIIYIDGKIYDVKYNTVSLDKKINQIIDSLIKLHFVTQVEDRELNKKIENLKSSQEADVSFLLKTSVFVNGKTSMGSGTVIAKSKTRTYILTCNHVIEDILNQTIEPQTGAIVGYNLFNIYGAIDGTVVYGASIIKSNKEMDLALLRIEFVDPNMEVAKIAETEPVSGDIIYTVGNPFGMLKTVSKGILSNHQEMYYIHDNTTTFGNSGGGLFNVNGELIGVPSQVPGYNTGFAFIPESGLGMSIDLSTIRLFLEGVDLSE